MLSVGSGLFAAAAPICPTMTPETYHILSSLTDTKIWVSAAYVDHTIYRHKYIVEPASGVTGLGQPGRALDHASPGGSWPPMVCEPIRDSLLEQKFGENHACWMLVYSGEHGSFGLDGKPASVRGQTLYKADRKERSVWAPSRARPIDNDYGKTISLQYERSHCQTKAGRVRGFQVDGTYTFYGINTRTPSGFRCPSRLSRGRAFATPTPMDMCVRCWTGNRCGRDHGSPPLLAQGRKLQYLNVWTQSMELGGQAAVMVWFHGGGLFCRLLH